MHQLKMRKTNKAARYKALKPLHSYGSTHQRQFRLMQPHCESYGNTKALRQANDRRGRARQSVVTRYHRHAFFTSGLHIGCVYQSGRLEELENIGQGENNPAGITNKCRVQPRVHQYAANWDLRFHFTDVVPDKFA